MLVKLMRWVKSAGLLPRVSESERQALDAGTVWIDGELFGGKPDFERILREPYPALSAEEQAFLEGPVEELCRMADAWEIFTRREVPEPLVRFMRENGFFALNIPKAYGGKAFSALGKSAVLAKLSPVSSALYNWVSIPSSIGSPELIAEYGTDAQKQHYLPKLARGEFYSCFGLTEPSAGSDATSIKAEAIVFRDALGGLKLRMNFRKRYITMAPVANLISLACQLRDPDNLLGKGRAPGITVVLLEKGTPGLHMGDRHDPLGAPFANGPVEGRDVVVPVDNIIGGAEGAGRGWTMLMEALAGGRIISLPASAVGGALWLARHVGAYSTVREQFGIPIGAMEGVRERVARIAALSYMMEGARVYSCGAVDAGHRPSVVSALMKYATTHLARELTNDAMDVMGGAAIMRGPNNFMHEGYATVPIAITVEGANILTRTLITFGQGTVRCHPAALDVVHAVERDDARLFRRALWRWTTHFAGAVLRSLAGALTRGWIVRTPGAGPFAVYYRRLGWSSARFAVLTNLLLFFVGADLKARGKLSGRMADVLTWMFLAIAALRRHEAEGRRAEDAPLVHWSVQYALQQIQMAYDGVYANFPGVVGSWSRTVGRLLLWLNPLGSGPADDLDAGAAATIQSATEQWRRLTHGQHEAAGKAGAGRLLQAFRLVTDARPILAALNRALRKGQLRKAPVAELARQAVAAGIIGPREVELLEQAAAARLSAIEVDFFAAGDLAGVGSGAPAEIRAAA